MLDVNQYGLLPIVPGLFLLPGGAGGRLPHSHAFVVLGEKDALIDAGCGIARLRELARVWKPDLVLASHSHPDHVSGMWVFADEEIVSPVQHGGIFWRFEPMAARFTGPELAAEWIGFVRKRMDIREVAARAHYRDGQVFDFGRLKLEAIHAPGHTDDHYVFFEPSHGVALLFDIDLSSFGPWYGHVESDIEAFLKSIRQVIALAPRIVVSSHKGVITDDIPGRLQRFADVIDRRDATILAMLDRPRTLAELIAPSPIFGGRPRAERLLRYWEGQMIEKHLLRLEGSGMAVHENELWRRA